MGNGAGRQTDPLLGGGEMGALMRSIDWSRTAVGAVPTWPQSLRTALSILLETGFPMYIAWGPEFIQFYNDGYRPILGSTKHPAAMGLSTRVTFAEIWNIIGPMFHGVMEGTATTLVDFLLPLDRHGFVEECYFIFSYSPIREEGGDVGGVLVTVTETDRARARRAAPQDAAGALRPDAERRQRRGGLRDRRRRAGGEPGRSALRPPLPPRRGGEPGDARRSRRASSRGPRRVRRGST